MQSDSGIHIENIKRQPGTDFKLLRFMRKLIKRRKIDVMHCHQYTPYFYGVVSAFLTRTRVIFTEHGRFYPDYGTWKRKLINPILQWFTHSIVAISEATKDALVTHENFSAQSIQVIYNGIEDKSFTSYDQAAIKTKWSIPEEMYLAQYLFPVQS